MFIELSENEISLLEKQAIKGVVRVFDDDKKIGNFPLELKVGEINENQLFVELQPIPKGVYIDKVKEYVVKIS